MTVLVVTIVASTFTVGGFLFGAWFSRVEHNKAFGALLESLKHAAAAGLISRGEHLRILTNAKRIMGGAVMGD